MIMSLLIDYTIDSTDNRYIQSIVLLKRLQVCYGWRKMLNKPILSETTRFFDRSTVSFRNIGENINSFILGYLSPDN